MAGSNLKGITNLIALVTLAQSFKADHGKPFTKLQQEIKVRIYELITDKTGNQKEGQTQAKAMLDSEVVQLQKEIKKIFQNLILKK